MKRRLFTDIDVSPTDTPLRKQLGVAFQYYEIMREISGGYRMQWQHTRGNGWLLRVGDMRGALYYLGPFEEGIEISLTVREAERRHLLNWPGHGKLQTELQAATEYPGGYALRFGIESLVDCVSVSELVKELIRQRGTAPASTKGLGRKRGVRQQARKPNECRPGDGSSAKAPSQEARD